MYMCTHHTHTKFLTLLTIMICVSSSCWCCQYWLLSHEYSVLFCIHSSIAIVNNAPTKMQNYRPWERLIHMLSVQYIYRFPYQSWNARSYSLGQLFINCAFICCIIFCLFFWWNHSRSIQVIYFAVFQYFYIPVAIPMVIRFKARPKQWMPAWNWSELTAHAMHPLFWS